MKRKIAAIIAADVAGYSRLVEEDEEDTLRRFIAASQVFKSLVQTHYGRVFNTAGDAILAEFSSSVEAVRCAAAIQARVREMNAGQPKHRQLLFRIGISVGDVIEHETDLLGDGVNIAARLQALASPGGLSISHWVQEQIAGKITLPFQDAGFHSVRNIAKPVHVFLANIGEAETPFTAPPAAPSPPRSIVLPRGAMVLVSGAVAVSVAVLLWRQAPRPLVPKDAGSAAVTAPALPKPAAAPPSPAPARVQPAALPPAAVIATTPPIEAVTPKPADGPVVPSATLPDTSGAPPPAEQRPSTLPFPLPVEATPVPEPKPAVLPLPVPAQHAPPRARSAALCAEIRERAQLGDISQDERDMLRSGCR